MQLPRFRFTIRTLMIAVAVVAGLLVVNEWGVTALVLCLPFLLPFLARRGSPAPRRRRRLIGTGRVLSPVE
jgi:hypothetical protein